MATRPPCVGRDLNTDNKFESQASACGALFYLDANRLWSGRKSIWRIAPCASKVVFLAAVEMMAVMGDTGRSMWCMIVATRSTKCVWRSVEMMAPWRNSMKDVGGK